MGWPRPIAQQSTTISMTALTPFGSIHKSLGTARWYPAGLGLAVPASEHSAISDLEYFGESIPSPQNVGHSILCGGIHLPSSGLCPTHTQTLLHHPVPRPYGYHDKYHTSSGWGPQGCSDMCERHKRAHRCNHLPQRTGHLGGPYPNRAANAYAGVTVAVGRARCGGAPAHSRAATSKCVQRSWLSDFTDHMSIGASGHRVVVHSWVVSSSPLREALGSQTPQNHMSIHRCASDHTAISWRGHPHKVVPLLMPCTATVPAHTGGSGGHTHGCLLLPVHSGTLGALRLSLSRSHWLLQPRCHHSDCNDPAAGSPTATLLRLLLPLAVGYCPVSEPPREPRVPFQRALPHSHR